MVSYRFEISEEIDLMNQRGEIPHISRFKVARHIFFTLILGLNIFYVQYLLFYQDNIIKDSPNLHYLIIIVLYFISVSVTTSFSARIFIINRETRDFTTVIVVSAVFIFINTYFSIYESVPIAYFISDFFKVIYSLVFTPLFLFLQITTFLRQVFVAKYAIQFKLTSDEESKQVFYDLMVRAEADAGLVSILDCYLRAAPQLIVQLAIFLHSNGDFRNLSVWQLASILIAAIMMPWSITSFQGALRMQQNHEVPLAAKTIYFLWHFFIMVSRIISISGAMAFWPAYTGMIILIHCITWTAWLWFKTEPMEFCNRNKFWHFLFCCVFGCVYFFFPLNLNNQPTRWKYIWFYLLMLFQIFVCNFMWYMAENEMSFQCKITLIVINVSVFIGGICFMMIYYKKLHPNENGQISDHDVLVKEIVNIDDIY